MVDWLAQLLAELISATEVDELRQRTVAALIGARDIEAAVWLEECAGGFEAVAFAGRYVSVRPRVGGGRPSGGWQVPQVVDHLRNEGLVAHRTEPLGATAVLVLAGPTDGVAIPDDEVTLLARTVARLAGLLTAGARESEPMVRAWMGDALAAELVGADNSSHRLVERAALLGVDLAAPHAVVAVGGGAPLDLADVERLSYTVGRLVPGALATVHRGALLVVWPATSVDALTSGVRKVLGSTPRMSVTAGIGRVVTEAADYGASTREAIFAMDTARIRSGVGSLVAAEELGLYRLAAQIVDSEPIRDFIAEALGPLIEADARSGLDLVHTLRVFLDHERRVAPAARDLFVHENTLRYRVRQIADLIDADFDDADTRYLLLLALRMATVLGVVRDPTDVTAG